MLIFVQTFTIYNLLAGFGGLMFPQEKKKSNVPMLQSIYSMQHKSQRYNNIIKSIVFIVNLSL